MRNGSGYIDPTMGNAITKVDSEKKRITKLMDTIKYICRLAGFDIEDRIILRDRKTGQIWR